MLEAGGVLETVFGLRKRELSGGSWPVGLQS